MRSAKLTGAPVTELRRASAPVEPGRVQEAVLAEITALEVAEAHPALCQAAVSMALILDDRAAVQLHPRCVKELRETLAELRKYAVRSSSSGRLATVRALRRSSDPTTDAS